MSIAGQIELACLMEATARKPGNVHPAAEFDDLCYDDFVIAAAAIGKPLSRARSVGLGRSVDDAVRATRLATGTNVNLGIILLLAPLAAVPDHLPLDVGIVDVLNKTTVTDAENVYSAICFAMPGGMGHATDQDIHQAPTVTLRAAMQLASDRDRIAEQYVSNYQLIFGARRKFCDLIERQFDWETAIVLLHLWIMSNWTDTLIARKCGTDIAEQARARARNLLEAEVNHSMTGPAQGNSSDAHDSFRTRSLPIERLAEFDAWLREDGHRRNPGTTADLVAAVLFAALRDGLFAGPSREEIQKRAAENSVA